MQTLRDAMLESKQVETDEKREAEGAGTERKGLGLGRLGPPSLSEISAQQDQYAWSPAGLRREAGASRLRVALLIETSSAYCRGCLMGIAKYLRTNSPWSIEFREGESCEAPPEWLKGWKGDGVIARVKTPAMAAAVAQLGVPVVDLYCGLPGLNLARIRSDDPAVGALGAHHLLQQGFRQFAFCGFNGTDWSDSRRTGFIECVKASNFPCYVFESFRGGHEEYEASYERQLQSWLISLPKPIGLMACNDARGQQILKACRDLGLKVPEDIAVIGVDRNEVLSELADVRLSSVLLNTLRIGYEAAALLDLMMAGQAAAPSKTLLIEPMRVAAEQSTDVFMVEDRNLAKALMYVQAHACEGVSIDQVASFAGLSRSVLQRRFKNVLHETVHEAIIRTRLKRACELLRVTDLPQIDIAEKSGFKHCEYMGVVFKTNLGKTPAQYRKDFKVTKTD